MEFTPYPKTPRLFRDIVVTEKLDGTNAAIGISENLDVWAQSRKRLITSADDNFGFAKWVEDNEVGLAQALGPGLHFGEYWGSGIQRGYGLEKGEKRFSLFNVHRFKDADFSTVPGLGVVPVLARWTFDQEVIEHSLQRLREGGSLAAPGFMNPEGIVVYHTAANQCFKVLLDQDEIPKGLVA